MVCISSNFCIYQAKTNVVKFLNVVSLPKKSCPGPSCLPPTRRRNTSLALGRGSSIAWGKFAHTRDAAKCDKGFLTFNDKQANAKKKPSFPLWYEVITKIIRFGGCIKLHKIMTRFINQAKKGNLNQSILTQTSFPWASDDDLVAEPEQEQATHWSSRCFLPPGASKGGR